ncbi:hypothetical protein CBR_g19153 [Chara braunii]|uniref:Uncharacterized protein n=1 Tax=Chara braunii TaxID=69332 RepID=A0A388KXK7_CHABU|nr:hypothetical protein CBR_g19153 [Chara braunii]|eukprot:GBG74748.1 hypothetical protein CBR_g19153 [Chara braunii]
MSRWKPAKTAGREPAATSTSVHKPGLCDIAYDSTGKYIVTCGSDGHVSVWHAGVTGKKHLDIPVSQQKRPITAAVVSPNGSFLAAGSEDNSVKLYTFPDGEFLSIVTRFSLAVRAVAFNSTGSILAAGGDAESIKLLTVPDCSTVCNLKAHEGQVCSLAFDPRDDYLLSSDTNGTIIVWDVAAAKAVHTLPHVAPRTVATWALRNCVGWHPDGSLFAVPGLSCEVILYKRQTAEVHCSLKGAHMADVGVIAWSPNGKYLASAGEDHQVLVWHVDERQDLGRLRNGDMTVSGLSWSPEGNAIALIDMDGKYRIWDRPVPEHMPSPTEGSLPPPVNSTVDRKKLMKFDESKEMKKGKEDDEEEEEEEEEEDEEEGEESRENGSEEEEEEEEDEDEEDRIKRRQKKHDRQFFGKDEDDKLDKNDSDGSETRFSKKYKLPTKKVDSEIGGGEKKVKKAERSTKDAKAKVGGHFAYPTQPQGPFQPCSTHKVDGRKRFLAYNLLGSITVREEDGHSSVEVEFHDTSTHTARVPVMTDYFGFTMAALSDKGCVFANPWKSEKHASTLFYRPFNSWAPRSECNLWSRMDAECAPSALDLGCWSRSLA